MRDSFSENVTDLNGNTNAEAGEADIMAEVVVVADSWSEDEKNHLVTNSSPAEEKVSNT